MKFIFFIIQLTHNILFLIRNVLANFCKIYNPKYSNFFSITAENRKLKKTNLFLTNYIKSITTNIERLPYTISTNLKIKDVTINSLEKL